jgi:hypothetical protein
MWQVVGGALKRAWKRPKGRWDWKSHEVRGFRAWYRHVTLALLAHAVLVVTRAQEKKREKPTRGSS